MTRAPIVAGVLATWCCCASSALAADFEIRVQDAAGTGFEDPTPVTPVGGNHGTTLGEQRRIAFEYAAEIWGELLESVVTIRVDARFSALTCSSNSAVLGSAGTNFVFQGFPGAPAPATWYHSALADSLAGVDLAPGLADISAQFNADLDDPDCLGGVGWYYGLDGNAGKDIDLVQVLLHELGHGLGFSNFVNEETGKLLLDEPDVYSSFTLDTQQGRSWAELSDAERVVSAKNSRRVVWSGVRVSEAAPRVLSSGVPLLRTTSASEQAWYPVAVASFGKPLTSKPIGGTVRAPAGIDLGCNTALPPGQAGVVLYLDLGSCGGETQAQAAEAAGAAALVLGMTSAGSPVKPLSGFQNVGIPVVSLSLVDASKFKLAAAGGLLADIREDQNVLIGADPDGRLQLNAPDPVKLGSSISHWDPTATPNLLMEPYANRGLAHAVDLSLPLLEDIGWNPGPLGGAGGSGGAGGVGGGAGGAPAAGAGGVGAGGVAAGGAGGVGGGAGSSNPRGGRGGAAGAGAAGTPGVGGGAFGGAGPGGGSGAGGSSAGAGTLPGGNVGGGPGSGGWGSLPAPPDAGPASGGSEGGPDAGAGDAALSGGAAGAPDSGGGYPDAGVRVVILAPPLDCGCRAAGGGTNQSAGWSLSLLGLAGLLRRRRALRGAPAASRRAAA